MPLNPYINLKRIEFVVTNACTSRCKHCSLGDTLNSAKTAIDVDKAVAVVTELAQVYDIGSVMTFGGEPLLYADTTCAIHKAATGAGIPSRQLITNGYFSKDEAKIAAVAKELTESGVNSLLLSVDAFHKEHVPLEIVRLFAEELCRNNTPGIKLHPAWVVNREHRNPYNDETERCLAYFADLQIPISSGNNIFPAGNAAVYLSEYYEKKPVDFSMLCGETPYTGRLDEVSCLAINPNGDVVVCCFVIGNIFRESITEIIKRYDPYANPYTTALMKDGVQGLIKVAEQSGISVEVDNHYTACGVCREIMKKVQIT